MLGHRAMNAQDYLALFKRRIWAFVIPVIVVPVAAILVARVLPKRYTATTTVLVNEPRINESIVGDKPGVNDDMNQRLSTIQQQILSRPNLDAIIDKYNLFPGKRGKAAAEDLEDSLAKQIVVTTVEAMPGSNLHGLPGFSISVTADRADLAQRICQDITLLFTQTNLAQRQESSENTTEFLEKQLQDAKANLDSQDARLAQFKERYVGQLPDEAQTNLSVLQSLTTQLDATTAELNRAQQDRAFTETLLEQQIAAQQPVTSAVASPDTLAKQLADAQARLLDLRSRYTDDYPDVIKAKHDVEVLKQQITQAEQAMQTAPPPKTPSPETATSPQIQQLRAQLHQYDEAIREKTTEQKHTQEQIQLYQSRINMSPVVEQEYKEITRDSQNALDFYNKLLTEKSQSSMVSGLVNNEGSEQFQVVDPAELPQRPTFPKLSTFAAGGLAGGFAIGLGLVLLLEMGDRSLRCEQDVEVLLRIPMLAQMPLIDTGPGKSFQRGPSVPEQSGMNLRV